MDVREWATQHRHLIDDLGESVLGVAAAMQAMTATLAQEGLRGPRGDRAAEAVKAACEACIDQVAAAQEALPIPDTSTDQRWQQMLDLRREWASRLAVAVPTRDYANIDRATQDGAAATALGALMAQTLKVAWPS